MSRRGRHGLSLPFNFLDLPNCGGLYAGMGRLLLAHGHARHANRLQSWGHPEVLRRLLRKLLGAKLLGTGPSTRGLSPPTRRSNGIAHFRQPYHLNPTTGDRHLLHNRHRRWGRDDFQPPPCTPSTNYDILSLVSANGEVAQLVEHHVRNVGVESSNLFFSTKPRETSKTRFRLSFRPRGVFCWQNCLTRPRLKPSISLVQGCLTRKDGGTEVCQADTTLRASPRIAPATQLAPPIAAPTGRPSAGGYSLRGSVSPCETSPTSAVTARLGPLQLKKCPFGIRKQ